MKKLYVLGGGTMFHVRNHLSLCAPAFGTTARALFDMCIKRFPDMASYIRLTKMADFTSELITNDDVSQLVTELKQDPETKVMFFNVALCDWTAEMAVKMDGGDERVPSGKYSERLRTSEGNKLMMLTPADKIIRNIRKDRPDIFVIGFKTTCGATDEQQAIAGFNLLTTSNINLVLANDTRSRKNMIIRPDGIHLATKDRDEALNKLVSVVRYSNLN